MNIGNAFKNNLERKIRRLTDAFVRYIWDHMGFVYQVLIQQHSFPFCQIMPNIFYLYFLLQTHSVVSIIVQESDANVFSYRYIIHVRIYSTHFQRYCQVYNKFSIGVRSNSFEMMIAQPFMRIGKPLAKLNALD